MRIIKEENLRDFNFWGGAKDTVKYLTSGQLDTIESILEEVYTDTLTETEINDLFWHEEDTIADWLGYTSFEEIMDEE